MKGKTRIILADDHPIVLYGLRNLVQAEDDLELVGEATSGLAALRLICEKQPHVAVLDISMPELNGILVARRLAAECPSVRLVILTLHEDRAYLNQAFQAGVRGYVLKRSAAENLIAAIRGVFVGGIYVDPALCDPVSEKQSARSEQVPVGADLPKLTEREAQVLRLVALGFSNKEIARRLDLGVESVETYRSRGTEKLALKTRADVVRYASAEGWLSEI